MGPSTNNVLALQAPCCLWWRNWHSHFVYFVWFFLPIKKWCSLKLRLVVIDTCRGLPRRAFAQFPSGGNMFRTKRAVNLWSSMKRTIYEKCIGPHIHIVNERFIISRGWGRAFNWSFNGHMWHSGYTAMQETRAESTTCLPIHFHIYTNFSRAFIWFSKLSYWKPTDANRVRF